MPFVWAEASQEAGPSPMEDIDMEEGITRMGRSGDGVIWLTGKSYNGPELERGEDAKGQNCEGRS